MQCCPFGREGVLCSVLTEALLCFAPRPCSELKALPGSCGISACRAWRCAWIHTPAAAWAHSPQTTAGEQQPCRHFSRALPASLSQLHNTLRECLSPRDSRAWTEYFCSPWPAQHQCQQLQESPLEGQFAARGSRPVGSSTPMENSAPLDLVHQLQVLQCSLGLCQQ